MEQYEEIRIPELNTGKEPRKKWILAAGIAAVCLAMLAVFGVMAVKFFNSEEKALIKGLQNLVEEAKERQELWEAAAGNTSMDGLGALKTTTTFNLSGDDLPVTLGIDTELLRDDDARRLQAFAALSVMNNELGKLDIYGEDETLMLTLPAIWKQNLAFHTNDIDKQYNDSLLAEKFGRIDEMDISFDLFPEKEASSWKETIEKWQERIDLISSRKKKDSEDEQSEMIIEKLEEMAEISIVERDNRQYRCSQYRITFPKERIENMEAYSEALEEEISISMMQDMLLLISLDENDRIVQIAFEEPVKMSAESEEIKMNMELNGYLCFVGEERSIDDMIVNMQMECSIDTPMLNEGAHLLLGESYDMKDEKVSMQVDIEVLFDENDTCVTTDLKKLTVSVDDIGDMKLTGKVTVEPLQEKIEPPEGETIWIFEMTEEEYEDLEQQLERKLLRWMLMNSLF